MGFKEEYDAPMEEAEPAEDMGLDAGSEPPELDQFEVEARSFLDESLPMEERTAALKNAIMACQGADYSEEEPKGEGTLLGIFGSPKK